MYSLFTFCYVVSYSPECRPDRAQDHCIRPDLTGEQAKFCWNVVEEQERVGALGRLPRKIQGTQERNPAAKNPAGLAYVTFSGWEGTAISRASASTRRGIADIYGMPCKKGSHYREASGAVPDGGWAAGILCGAARGLTPSPHWDTCVYGCGPHARLSAGTCFGSHAWVVGLPHGHRVALPSGRRIAKQPNLINVKYA